MWVTEVRCALAAIWTVGDRWPVQTQLRLGNRMLVKVDAVSLRLRPAASSAGSQRRRMSYEHERETVPYFIISL